MVVMPRALVKSFLVFPLMMSHVKVNHVYPVSMLCVGVRLVLA